MYSNHCPIPLLPGKARFLKLLVYSLSLHFITPPYPDLHSLLNPVQVGSSKTVVRSGVLLLKTSHISFDKTNHSCLLRYILLVMVAPWFSLLMATPSDLLS